MVVGTDHVTRTDDHQLQAAIYKVQGNGMGVGLALFVRCDTLRPALLGFIALVSAGVTKRRYTGYIYGVLYT